MIYKNWKEDGNKMTDHEILIRLSERVELIYQLLTNHLEHHFWFNITLLAAVIGLSAALITILLKRKGADSPVQPSAPEGDKMVRSFNKI